MCKVIGVSGGIASGKSLFVAALGELGAHTLSADDVARELFEPGSDVAQQVIEHFGPDIVLPDGNINRQKLGEIVFGSDEARHALNGIVHPPTIRRINSQIELFRNQHSADNLLMVVEVPLLFECEMAHIFDLTVAVSVEQEQQISRLTNQRGMSPAQATERISAQMSDAERCALADVVIQNNGSIEQLKENACKIFCQYTSQ